MISSTRDLKVILLNKLNEEMNQVIMIKLGKEVDDEELYDGCKMSKKSCDNYCYSYLNNIYYYQFIGLYEQHSNSHNHI